MTAKKTTKTKDEGGPVSPRTPQTTPIAPQTNATADAGGPHVPSTAGNKQESSTVKKADLTIFRVRHDGHDGPGHSIVAADSEGRAKQLVGDDMIKANLGHTHGLMQAFAVDDTDSAAQFNPSSEGVIYFDNGRHPA